MGIDIIALALDDLGRWDAQLLELVRGEKINPWDIDIALLTQKYLEKINSMGKIDFRIPGKAVHTAAILLRIKSEKLLEEEKIRIEEEIAKEKGVLPDIIIPDLKPIAVRRERKITVFELVDALREAFEVDKRKMERRKLITQVTNIEFMSERLKGIRRILLKIFEKIQDDRKIDFVELLKYGDFSLTFYAIIDLANRGFVDLVQDDWNTGIYIVKSPSFGAVMEIEKEEDRRELLSRKERELVDRRKKRKWKTKT